MSCIQITNKNDLPSGLEAVSPRLENTRVNVKSPMSLIQYQHES